VTTTSSSARELLFGATATPSTAIGREFMVMITACSAKNCYSDGDRNEINDFSLSSSASVAMDQAEDDDGDEDMIPPLEEVSAAAQRSFQATPIFSFLPLLDPVVPRLESKRMPSLEDERAEQLQQQKTTAATDKVVFCKECIICCDRPVNTVLVGCGHCMFCVTCSRRLMMEGDGKCPVCKCAIERAMKIYTN
jgi:hypothetical protein